jgi:hypothetical protein
MEKYKMQMFGLDLQNQVRGQEYGMSQEEHDARVSVAKFNSELSEMFSNREYALETTYKIYWQCRVPGACPVLQRLIFSYISPERHWGDMTLKEFEDGAARYDLAVQEELQKEQQEQDQTVDAQLYDTHTRIDEPALVQITDQTDQQEEQPADEQQTLPTESVAPTKPVYNILQIIIEFFMRLFGIKYDDLQAEEQKKDCNQTTQHCFKKDFTEEEIPQTEKNPEIS